MKTIYLDSDFKCHLTNPNGTYREIETDFFDDKCTAFIEGYRYIPSGETWTRSDGTVFTGAMITPCKDYSELAKIQSVYKDGIAFSETRTAALEAENAALKEENATQAAQITALSDQLDFYEDCIAEMAEVVYA